MLLKANRLLWAFSLLLLCGITGCASKNPQTPYPAFIQVEELPDVFVAGLPGVRAKQLAGNPKTRRSSNLVELPSDWNFTTGASPGKSVEIFVLAGEITIGDLSLDSGSYAYIPPGNTGLQMRTGQGALLLYFLDDANPNSVIQTPLVRDSDLVGWTPLSEDPKDIGVSVKILREDPGSGARTWLEKVDPFATRGWQRSSVTREGYLVSGSYRASECINGEAVTGDYAAGGYFHRVSGALNGGPDTGTTDGAVWLLRVLEQEALQEFPDCVVARR